MNRIENVSRRGFLSGMVSAGALVLGARFVPEVASAQAAPGWTPKAEQMPMKPNVFLGIDTDGTVWIVAHRSEMGTSSKTTLPVIVADELDADWKRVRIEQAIAEDKYGSQNTDGSHSVREFFTVLREAGASARQMLIRAASQKWNVPENEITTEPHTLIHAKSGKRADYSEFVADAAKLPAPSTDSKNNVQLKTREQWRYIGKDIPIYDLADICRGAAGFAQDAKIPGMVYAAVERCPVLGGKVKTVDNKTALQVKGVAQTVEIPAFKPPHAFQALGGVAVIADNSWSAFQGRKGLKVDWEFGPNAGYNSDQYRQKLLDTAHQPGKVVRSQGDVDAEFAKGGKILEADYYAPHLAHASMEPPAAVAQFSNGRLIAWACVQDPQGTRDAVAAALGIDKKNVEIHVTLLGGGFGRKSKPDFVVEAALLARQLNKPVKVVWSREDDLKFDYYHSVAGMYQKAALDAKGMPSAWLLRSVFPPIGSTFTVGDQYGGAFELGMGWSDLPFDVPHMRAENGPADAHVRIGWLRSVANIYHVFAVQGFIDEMAHAAKRDPVEYQLALLGQARQLDLKMADGKPYWNYGGDLKDYPFDVGRLRNVMDLVAQQSQWSKRKSSKGHGFGFAAHHSFHAYVATVVEVEIDDAGKVRIPNVWTAVDAGTLVNPDRVVSQFEGAAVFGASIARTGQITATDGRVDQSNFFDYPVARIHEAPYQTHVHLVKSTAPPGGVGEPGVPPMVPAMTNAVFAASGKRIRDLPLSRHNFS